MKKFSIELLKAYPDPTTIEAKISINGIPLIQDNGKPEITLYLPGDFIWLLDVIRGKENSLCFTDFGSVISFNKKGSYYSITLNKERSKEQRPIKGILIPCEAVEKETLSAINKFIDVVTEKDPKLLVTPQFKRLIAGANDLAKETKKNYGED